MATPLFPSLVRGFTYTIVKTPEFKTIEQAAANGFTTRIPQMKNPIWHFTMNWDYIYNTYRSPNNAQAYAPYTDLQAMMGFFLQAKGKSGEFLLIDKEDYTAGGLRSNVWRPQWQYPAGTAIIDFSGNAYVTIVGGLSGTQLPVFNTGAGAGAVTTEGSIAWIFLGNFPNGWTAAPVTLPLLNDGLGNYYTPVQRDMGGMFLEDIPDLIPGSLKVFAAGAPADGMYSLLGPGLALPGASYMGMYLKWATAPPTPITATFQFYFRVQFEDDTQDFENFMKGLWTIGGSNSKNGSGTLKMKSSRIARV